MAGRRGARVEDAGRWVFNRLAAAYQSRPGYPEALVERLSGLAAPGRRAVDLGAGTGDLALPLAVRGIRVAAVEPARMMLDVLEHRAKEQGIALREAERDAPRAAETGTPSERLIPVHAAAEATGLPAASFDLSLVADALHWLDPELAGAEIARLLAPGGALAVVEVELLPSPFLDALWPQLQASNPKSRPRALDLAGPRAQLLSLAAPGAAATDETFDCEDALSPEAAAAVVASLSFVGPALSPLAVDALTTWARDHARARGATWRRRLHIHWARRK
ncbi:MAG TPA: class I SAM-dependent methyltransferase [Myxococcaceae bacterium]|jgi:SAM-dependent methyltransferase